MPDESRFGSSDFVMRCRHPVSAVCPFIHCDKPISQSGRKRYETQIAGNSGLIRDAQPSDYSPQKYSYE
jgi:hypothetical protein